MMEHLTDEQLEVWAELINRVCEKDDAEAFWELLTSMKAGDYESLIIGLQQERASNTEHQKIIEVQQAELDRLQSLADTARLLNPARIVLDRCAEGVASRDEAADMAQRIVDLIGHSVTDEPPHAIVELEAARKLIGIVRYEKGNGRNRSWVKEALITGYWYPQAMDPVERAAYGHVLEGLREAEEAYDAVRAEQKVDNRVS